MIDHDKVKNQIIQQYDKKMEKHVTHFQSRIENGTATARTAQNFAERSGDIMQECIIDAIEANPELLDEAGALTDEVANAILKGPLQKTFDDSARYTANVQEMINRRSGMGIKGVAAEYDRAIEGKAIQNAVGKEFSTVKENLKKEIIASALQGQGDTLRDCSEVLENLGVDVIVSRTYDGVGVHNGRDDCQWCLQRCGTYYGYGEAEEAGAFERHPGCGCTIEILHNTLGYQKQTNWQNNTWSN